MEALLEMALRARSEIARTRALCRNVIREFGRVQMNCSVHGPFFAAIHSVSTGVERSLLSPCPQCISQAEANKRCHELEVKGRRQQAALEARLSAADIPPRFVDLSFNHYTAENPGQTKALRIVKDFVENFPAEHGTSLVLAGLPGTGKSMLSAVAVHQVCRRGYSARYTTCQELILAVRRTWGSNGEGRESDVFEAFAGASLLVIDEVGVQAGTDSEKAILFEVLDRRYRHERPTILATNLAKESFQEFVGDRIWDRLCEVASWVPFGWASYRPIQRSQMARNRVER